MPVRVVTLAGLDDPAHALRLGEYTRLKDVDLRSVREPADGLFLAEGRTVIRRALAAGLRPRSFLLTPARWAELADTVAVAVRGAGDPDVDVPVFLADVGQLAALTGVRLHRGALAAIHRPPAVPMAEVVAAARRVVVLEDVVDHTNVGAVFRSAAALGADAVLVSPRCADPLYRRSVRVSMGTVFQVPWARVDPWPEALDLLRAGGFVIAALVLSEVATDLGELARDPPRRLALLLGTESDGLSRRTLAVADRLVRIPMAAGVDSLNVAAAAAVALWAVRC